MNASDDLRIDALDRRLIVATQAGLPLVPRPYALLAAAVGAGEDEVIDRLRLLLDRGVIRRIGAVPNHYALGYGANAMNLPAASTKVRVMSHVLYAQRGPMSSRARTERRWRCCLPT